MSREDDDASGKRLLPCSTCGVATEASTLRNCGARCFPCFARYCRAPRQWPAIPRGLTGPRAWLQRLRWRQQHGQTMTFAQAGAIAEMQSMHPLSDFAVEDTTS